MGKNFRSPSQATTSGASETSFTGMTNREKLKVKTAKKYKACCTFIYNKEKKTFCNRTCLSWLLILLFYFIFIAVLLGSFFAALFGITHYIRHQRTEPLFDKKDLMPKGSPGLSIFPKTDEGLLPLIWYTHSGTSSPTNARPEMYVNAIDRYFKRYKNQNPKKYKNCTEDAPPRKGERCGFNLENLGPCGKDGYGYNDDKPCIYLKVNKLKQWTPECYKPSSQLPDDMPSHLVTAISGSSKSQIWVSCDGVKDFDRDHMGNLKYYPGQGFEEFYFPFDGTADYLTPIVGVQFENLDHGLVVAVRCSIWADNIQMDDIKYHSSLVFLYTDVK